MNAPPGGRDQIRDVDFIWHRQTRSNDGFDMHVVSPYGGDEIAIRFPCAGCGRMIHAFEIVPSPFFGADSLEDSNVCETQDVACESCETEYEVEVHNAIGGMLVQIDGISHTDIEYSFTGLDPAAHLNHGLGEIRERLKVPENQLLELDRRLLFAHAVSLLETYLQDRLFRSLGTAFQRVLESIPTDDSIGAWVARLKSFLMQVLSSPRMVIYHRVELVEKLYKDLFGITFDTALSSKLRDLVKARHQIVHRAARTLEGKRVEITKKDLEEACDVVSRMAVDIEKELKSLEHVRADEDPDESEPGEF